MSSREEIARSRFGLFGFGFFGCRGTTVSTIGPLGFLIHLFRSRGAASRVGPFGLFPRRRG